MPETFVHIDSGKILNPVCVKKIFGELPTGKHLLKIEKADKRTSPQNRYLHMMFSLIKDGLQDIGYREIKTAEDAKYVCKNLFLSYEIDNGSGGKIKMVRRTRALTIEQMAVFIDEVIQWSAEYLSVTIPAPEQQFKMFEQ